MGDPGSRAAADHTHALSAGGRYPALGRGAGGRKGVGHLASRLFRVGRLSHAASPGRPRGIHPYGMVSGATTRPLGMVGPLPVPSVRDREAWAVSSRR